MKLFKIRQRLIRSIDEIAAVSQQAAAGIEETSATVEQSSSAMDEIF